MYYATYLPTIDPILMHLYGPLAIRWYSLAYLFGMLFSWWQLKQLIKIYPTKITDNDIEDFIPLAILSIIIGGRLGHVLIYDPVFYLTRPFDILKIYEGGMAFHGAVIGLAGCIYFYFKKRQVKFFEATDLVLTTASIGILFGRIANFINGELYGRITKSPLGVVFFNAEPNGAARHPSQLYEAATEGLLLYLIMIFFAYRRHKLTDHGFLTGLWCLLYSIFRFVTEFYREPDGIIDLQLVTLSTGQMLSLIMGSIGLLIIKYRHLLTKNG